MKKNFIQYQQQFQYFFETYKIRQSFFDISIKFTSVTSLFEKLKEISHLEIAWKGSKDLEKSPKDTFSGISFKELTLRFVGWTYNEDYFLQLLLFKQYPSEMTKLSIELNSSKPDFTQFSKFICQTMIEQTPRLV
jgi:hypothetical protein